MTVKLLLDMDGVIADFHKALADIHGVESIWKTPGEWKIEKGYGIPEPWWELCCTKEFWENVPRTPEANYLVESVCEQFDMDDICIYTSIPTKDKYFPIRLTGITVQGKINWLVHHFPELLTHFQLGTSKHFSASPSTILLDDLDHHVDDFRHHGGKAILFPRPWNKLHSFEGDATEYVLDRLLQLKG